MSDRIYEDPNPAALYISRDFGVIESEERETMLRALREQASADARLRLYARRILTAWVVVVFASAAVIAVRAFG